jgi:ComF family protein
MSGTPLKIINHVRNTRDFIYNLLFPVECIICGQEGKWLCSACSRNLPFRDNQSCFHCKKASAYARFCPSCQKHYRLDGVWIAGSYDNPVIATMIKSLKYRFVRDLAVVLGKYAAIFLRNLINRIHFSPLDLNRGLSFRKFEDMKNAPQTLLQFDQTLLIPVPLHKKRLRWRGFNQAQAIGQAIANILPFDYRPDCLRRTKYTRPQAKLKEKSRLKNVFGCFNWCGIDLNSQNVILVDDVATTGATLNECARVLKDHGANEVWGLVIAKG